MLDINKFHKLRYLEIYGFWALLVEIFMMASMKQLFCNFPGQCSEVNLSSKKHHSNMVLECHSFYLGVGGQTGSYFYITRDSAVINYFQNHNVLLFLFSTDSTQSTENKISLLKIKILKFVSTTYRRRGDTNRIWPPGSQYAW